MGKTTFQSERFASVIDEAEPLLLLHWNEIAHFKDIPLDVDRSLYQQCEDAGKLLIYTVRDADDKLIGYAAFLVGQNSHYNGSGPQAKQDVLFLHPEYRGTRVGLQFIKFCDAQLAAAGVQVVYQHEKIAHPALGRVLQHEGYECLERLWAKRLDKERV